MEIFQNTLSKLVIEFLLKWIHLFSRAFPPLGLNKAHQGSEDETESDKCLGFHENVSFLGFQGLVST